MTTYRLYCFVLDLGYPMDQQRLEFTLTALENVLILASSSKTHSQMSSITISTVNQNAQNLGVFPVIGDLKNVQALIGNIRSTAKSNWRLSLEEYEDFLQLAIATAMNEYKLKVKNFYAGKGGRMRIAVLSSKPGRTLGRVLSSIRRRWANLKADAGAAAEISGIAPIQVIDTSAPGGVNLGWPNQITSDGSDDLDEDFHPKIIVQKATTLQSIQDELKRFLMVPDPHIVKLVISADAITTSKMADAVDDSGTVLVCEATPVTVDPCDLPASVASNFLIPPTKDDVVKPRYEFDEPESQKTVRCLIIKGRVSYDGVCDGSTFGMPFYLSPISFETATATMTTFQGSKTDANVDGNKEMFWAIHHLLTEREEVLLTTLESSEGTGGNFLIHAGGDCMLLQAIRSVELALPASNEASTSIRKNVPAHTIARAENILDPLPRQNYYRPSKYPTGVFPHLSSILKGSVQKTVQRKKISASQHNKILSFVTSQKEKSSKSNKKT